MEQVIKFIKELDDYIQSTVLALVFILLSMFPQTFLFAGIVCLIYTSFSILAKLYYKRGNIYDGKINPN